jgi:CRISPR-associated protein Cas1
VPGDVDAPDDEEDVFDDVVDGLSSDDAPSEDDEELAADAVDGPDEQMRRGGWDRERKVRILVADEHRKPLYITDSAARLGCEKGLFVVKKTEGDETKVLGRVRVRDTSHVAIFGRAQVSTMALREAMDRGIPVSFFTFGGYFAGMATGQPHRNVVLREAQWRAALDEERALAVAKEMVRSKLRNQRTMLRRNASGLEGRALREMSDLAARAREARDAGELLGIEGAAAAVYFRGFPRMLKPRDEDAALAFDFATRNRRPPRDPVNALLSLVYALLARECAAVAGAVGFDAAMGFYHRPRYGRPALGLDLMEELRPLVADSVVLSVVNQGEVGPGDFVTRADGCNLTDAGRRAVLRAYERRMGQVVTHPVFGYRVTWRRVLEVQARLLAKCVLGEVPRYVPMETR